LSSGFFTPVRFAVKRLSRNLRFLSPSIEPPRRLARLSLQEANFQGRVMTADRAGLGFLGLIFGGVTAAVMLVACTVVVGHLDGRLQIESQTAAVSSSVLR
jgi:hypothetical protein